MFLAYVERNKRLFCTEQSQSVSLYIFSIIISEVWFPVMYDWKT